MPVAPAEFAPWHGVFETLRVVKGTALFEAEHRAELARAADALGLKIDLDFEESRAALPPKSGRLRWIVTRETTHAYFTEEPPPATDPVALAVSPVRVGSHNWDARFKTLSYLTHAQAAAGPAEGLLLNEHGQVASAARANIFWRRGDRLFTPAHEVGCRCGVVRSFVLKQRKVEEGAFGLDDLETADEILVTSSLRGIVSVREFEGRKLGDFSQAGELRRAYAAAVQAQLPRAATSPSSSAPAGQGPAF
jgi:branched-subunit amino acid aminotransferase/4-amino-4-deoxychorismate lyase